VTPTVDELAGIADLFGALTRAELARALDELAFKRGADVDGDEVAAAVDDALDAFALVAVERDGATLLAPGPTAFPALPDGAADLPHILDVPERDPDRTVVARAAEGRLRTAAASAAAEGDTDRIRRLLDVTYDLEAWAGDEIDASDLRERLVTALE
jgi:hypothetical protein